MKKLLFLSIVLVIILPINVKAEENNITSKCNIKINDKTYETIIDDDYNTYEKFNKNENVDITCDVDIEYIYVLYSDYAVSGVINNKQKIGQNGYLHELIKVKKKTKKVNIKYDDKYKIAEIYIFSKGKLPEWVENWKKLKKSDLMLFSAHSDDEHLYFAGLLPTYVDKGYKIQVVYLTNHYQDKARDHERLEGLWKVGIKYYPVVGFVPDNVSFSLQEAKYNLLESGITEEEVTKYFVEQIRKYRPLVIVSHDENGEYGHGQHMLCTDILKKAIINANDKSYDKKSYIDYDVWNVKKVYFHLYKKNRITLDFDIPLNSYDNKTAYEVSISGYKKHKSQYKYFEEWLLGENKNYTKITEIEEYNPAIYGLYFSSVGEDINKNNLFENIKKSKLKDFLIDLKQLIFKFKYKFRYKGYFNVFKDYIKNKLN